MDVDKRRIARTDRAEHQERKGTNDMMFTEFQQGTGCKDNEYNRKVFAELEVLYMNSDSTKEHIYEIGKKLIDNSKSKEELLLEMEIKGQIEELKEAVKAYREEIKRYREFLETETEKKWRDTWKYEIKWRKENLQECRRKITALKWVLE